MKTSLNLKRKGQGFKGHVSFIQNLSLSLPSRLLSFSRGDTEGETEISPRRWNLLVDGISRSLYRWNRRLSLSGRRIRVSLALLDDSASLSLSLDLVDESASPSLSSTIPPPSRSPRCLRVSLALHDGSPGSSFTPPLSPARGYPRRNQTEIKSKVFFLLCLNHSLLYRFVCCVACVSCLFMSLDSTRLCLCLYLLIIFAIAYVSVFVYIDHFIILHVSHASLMFVYVSWFNSVMSLSLFVNHFCDSLCLCVCLCRSLYNSSCVSCVACVCLCLVIQEMINQGVSIYQSVVLDSLCLCRSVLVFVYVYWFKRWCLSICFLNYLVSESF